MGRYHIFSKNRPRQGLSVRGHKLNTVYILEGFFTLFPIVRWTCLKTFVLAAVYILRISDYLFSSYFKPSIFCFNAIKTIVFQIPRTLIIHCLKYHKNQHVCINEDKHVSYYFKICNFKHYSPSVHVTLFERLAALSSVNSLIVCLLLMKSHMQCQNMSEQRGEPVCTCMQAFSFTFWKCLLTCDIIITPQGHNHLHVM